MAEHRFSFSRRELPATAFMLHWIAHRLYIELARDRGKGAWIDDLRAALKTEARNMVGQGIPMEDEVAAVEEMLKAVDSVFDPVGFDDKL